MDNNALLAKKSNLTLNNLKGAKAEPGSRIGGSLIDGLFGVIVAVIIIAVTTGFDAEKIVDSYGLLMVYSGLAGIILGMVIPIILKGQTIGKKMTGTRMIDLNGNHASPGLIIGRSLFYTIPNLLSNVPVIGGLISLAMFVVYIISVYQLWNDPHGRTVQDKVVGTMVADDVLLQKIRESHFRAKEMKAEESKNPYATY